MYTKFIDKSKVEIKVQRRKNYEIIKRGILYFLQWKNQIMFVSEDKDMMWWKSIEAEMFSQDKRWKKQSKSEKLTHEVHADEKCDKSDKKKE